tara:strand:+ start:1043 stop:2980 length:1938 start_codon:yes stop_codon:yes gene_type:complete
MANNGKNPYNERSGLFRALTRIFSGPIVNRRTQTGRQLRRRHLDMFASRFTSASGKQFKKVEHNPMNSIALNMVSNRNRSERYIDFDEMEYEPIIASSIDIYADEITTHSTIQPMLKIKCPNEEIKSILQSLYFNILNIDHNLFGWARTMCKYGDLFLYLDIDDKTGIRNCIGVPPQEIERLEGEDESNPNYVQFQWNAAGMTLENWQVAHFRVLGNDKHYPYGTSVLESARRIWRQLTLLEDAMMAYRIVRSPERRAFYIDVGAIPPQDVEQYMQKVMTQMKRHQVVDQKTGRVDLRYNPLSIEEDYFIPVRGGTSNTKIESLPGGNFTGQIDDVKYLREKLFAALKIPQSYLVMGEGAQEDKTTLAQKDIRFARTIQRLQRSIISELEKIGIVHLFTLGFRGDDLLSFKLGLNNPSKIAELQDLEHWKVKFEAASSATENYFSKRWVAENMLGISEEEYLRMQREMMFDRKFMAGLEAISQAAAEGGAGALGGDLVGDLGEEEFDLGDDEVEAPDTGEEDDDVLLAAPGKRDDMWVKASAEKYTRNTPNKYNPHKTREPYDVKKTNGNKDGGRLRSLKKTATGEYGNTNRSKWHGWSDLRQLSKGIAESHEIEENILFSTKIEVASLLEGLNKNKKKEKENET